MANDLYVSDCVRVCVFVCVIVWPEGANQLNKHLSVSLNNSIAQLLIASNILC